MPHGYAELPDFRPVFGKRFDVEQTVVNHNGAEVHGSTWEIVGQNRLHIPYVSRMVRGKRQKCQYGGPVFTLICLRILEAD